MSRPARVAADNAGYPPRGMRADRAGAYFGMSEDTFLRLVADKVFPKGIPIRGMVVWDRLDLETAWDNFKAKQEEGKIKSRNSIAELLGVQDDEESEEH